MIIAITAMMTIIIIILRRSAPHALVATSDMASKLLSGLPTLSQHLI